MTTKPTLGDATNQVTTTTNIELPSDLGRAIFHLTENAQFTTAPGRNPRPVSKPELPRAIENATPARDNDENVITNFNINTGDLEVCMQVDDEIAGDADLYYYIRENEHAADDAFVFDVVRFTSGSPRFTEDINNEYGAPIPDSADF